MRNIVRDTLVSAAMLLAFAVPPAQSAPDDFSGRWEVQRRFGSNPHVVLHSRMIMQARDDAIVASLGRLQFEGKQQGNSLLLRCMLQPGLHGERCGEVTLRKTAKGLEGAGVLYGVKTEFVATRPVTPPPGSPKLHVFEPSVFHVRFTDAVSPALRVFPGDTVRTKTLDAAGLDENEKHRSIQGNPQTGPFYVEGALPGDTLAVRFNRIRPNRSTARIYSNVVLVGAFEPAYVHGLKLIDNWNGTWKLDRENGTATLVQPSDKLKHFSVKLDPMLGGVGVAPPNGQSISTSDLGPFGGNMDYQGIREGVTVHLPVFAPGALLFIGDGHAMQGDGELPGQGLETSMDVEFTVQVIENDTLGQPWVEDAEYVMVMGISGSLPESLQRATTGLTRWLEKRYQLNSAEIAMVLGTSIKYDIAEIVDPHINVVAKIPKAVLEQIASP